MDTPLADTWPLPHRGDLRDELLTAYRTDRGYHDARHLAEVLDRLAELGSHDDTELVLAAWFHDAVYDGARSDNEDASARWALAALADEDVDADEVARLVRLTAGHQAAPGDTRGELLCDADLGILAATPERYAEYAAEVREEYATYDDASFAAGRLGLLTDLAGREQLFRTPYGREHWDAAARANLAGEIARLRQVAG